MPIVHAWNFKKCANCGKEKMPWRKWIKDNRYSPIITYKPLWFCSKKCKLKYETRKVK